MKVISSSALHSPAIVLLLLLNVAWAAPHDALLHPLEQLHETPSSWTFGPRPWTKVRDWVVERFWPSEISRGCARTASASHPQARHHDDLVLRFNVSSRAEVASLIGASEALFLDVWGSTQEWIDIRLSREAVPPLLNSLPVPLQSAHTLLMDSKNLARAIRESYSETQFPPGGSFSKIGTSSIPPGQGARDELGPNIFFREYRPLSVVHPWMRLLSSLFSTHVQLVNIGQSFEGRDILAFKVGVHPTNEVQPKTPRKTILITGGAHAREWISIATVNYIAYSFITSYGKAGEVTRLLEEFDWVFIPTINPDGYAYSWDTDRLWRKSRQNNTLRFCPGIDLDRNFGFMWDHKSTEDNPCSESYAGEAAFQGEEAKQLAAWARNQTASGDVDFVGLIDLHSYSQQILYPYSYSCSEVPPTLEDLEELGEGLAKAIRLNRRHVYKVVPACEGNVFGQDRNSQSSLENGGGSLLDWFYHEMGVRNAYQIKLPDTGSHGFLLPKSYIAPTGEELFQAVKYFGVSLTSSASSRKSTLLEQPTELQKPLSSFR